MKYFVLFFFVGFSVCLFSQEKQISKYGLKIPNQKYLDSLPKETFRPKSSVLMDSSKDLSFFMPTPGNQAGQNSCTAWSVGYGLKSYQEKMETGNTMLFSPSFIFNSFPNNSDCENGLYFYEAFNFLMDEGICELSDMAYDENDCSTQPSYTAYNNALKYKIEDWKTIYASKNYPIDDIYEVKANIYNGKPVAIAVWLDSKIATFIDDTTANKPKFIWSNPLNDTSKTLNYHAMLCVGYDDINKEFKVLNSYGPNSGNDGYVYISYDAFTKAVYEAYYAIDSNNEGKYVYATKPSKQKSEFGITDTNFNFYGWLKKGYFIQINDEIKLSCAYLKKSKDIVILRLYDTSSEKEKMIGSYKFNSGDAYEISYQGNNYNLKLDKIGSAGKNIFKSAAFVNFSSN